MDSEINIKMQFAAKTTLQNSKTELCEIIEIPQGSVIILCKGHNGSNNTGAAVAAEKVVNSVKQYFSDSIKNPIKAMQGALMLANFTVYDYAGKNETFNAIAAELLLIVIFNDLIYYVSAGNNQLFLQREGTLYKLISPSGNNTAKFIGKDKNSHFLLSKNPVQAAINDVLFFSTCGFDLSFSENQIAELLSQDDLSVDLLCYQIIYKIEDLQENHIAIGICRLLGENTPAEKPVANNAPQKTYSDNIVTENPDNTCARFAVDNEIAENSDNTISELEKQKSRKKTGILNRKNILIITAIVLAITLITYNFSIDDEIITEKKQPSTTKSSEKQNKKESKTDDKTIKTTEVEKNTEPDKSSEQNMYEYTVKKGDNLYQIAIRFATTRAELTRINSLKSEKLRFDQKVKIPVTAIHTVKSGETLSTIAQRYNILDDDLKKANQYDRNTKLIVGKTIIIPVKKQ